MCAYKAEFVHRRWLWKTKESVKFSTIGWVSCFNHHRLLEPIGYIPLVEAEANYCRHLANQAAAEIAFRKPNGFRESQGDSVVYLYGAPSSGPPSAGAIQSRGDSSSRDVAL